VGFSSLNTVMIAHYKMKQPAAAAEASKRNEATRNKRKTTAPLYVSKCPKKKSELVIDIDCYSDSDATTPPRARAKALTTMEAKPIQTQRPDVMFEDTPGTDSSAWIFPTDKPSYLSPFIEFMNFVYKKAYSVRLGPYQCRG
jgi:hypothetical protein